MMKVYEARFHSQYVLYFPEPEEQEWFTHIRAAKSFLFCTAVTKCPEEWGFVWDGNYLSAIKEDGCRTVVGAIFEIDVNTDDDWYGA